MKKVSSVILNPSYNVIIPRRFSEFVMNWMFNKAENVTQRLTLVFRPADSEENYFIVEGLTERFAKELSAEIEGEQARLTDEA